MDSVVLLTGKRGRVLLSIWASFADLPDPRTGNAQRHNLLDLLTIALVATICGAESCVDFADFARDREAMFRDFLQLPGGLPSHDTFSRLFRLLDPTAFAACFGQFLEGLGEGGPGVIAIDGKTLRRSFDRAASRSALHVVTAFAAEVEVEVEAEVEVDPVWWSLSSFSRRSPNASHSSALLA